VHWLYGELRLPLTRPNNYSPFRPAAFSSNNRAGSIPSALAMRSTIATVGEFSCRSIMPTQLWLMRMRRKFFLCQVALMRVTCRAPLRRPAP
jgi:hypothetical protein